MSDIRLYRCANPGCEWGHKVTEEHAYCPECAAELEWRDGWNDAVTRYIDECDAREPRRLSGVATATLICEHCSKPSQELWPSGKCYDCTEVSECRHCGDVTEVDPDTNICYECRHGGTGD